MSHSCAPVHPIAVIGASIPLYLHLPFYRRFAVKAESNPAIFRRELQLVPFSLPILRRCPLPRFLRMPDLYPGTSLMKKRAIYSAVGPLATDSCVVITPSSYDWPKLHEQMRLGGHFLLGDTFSHTSTMPLHRFLAWFDDGFESKLGLVGGVWSNGEPKKVESRFALIPSERMRDACFTWFQFQTHTAELLRDDALTLLDHCTVFVYDDQIIGVANHCRDFPPTGKCVFDAVFQAV